MDQPIRRRLPTDPPPEQGNSHVHPIFADILNGMRMCPKAAAANAANDARADALQDRYGAFPGHAV